MGTAALATAASQGSTGMMGNPCDQASTCVGACVHTCVPYTHACACVSRTCQNIKEESTASEETGEGGTVLGAAGHVGRGRLSRVRRAQLQPPPQRPSTGRPRGASPCPRVAPQWCGEFRPAPARAAVGFPDGVEAPEQRGPPAAWPLEGRTPVALSPSAAGENQALRGLSSCPSPGRPVRVQPHPHEAHLATTLGSRAWPPKKPKAALKGPQQDLCPWPPDSTHSPGGLSPLAAPPGHRSRGHPVRRIEGSSAQAPRPLCGPRAAVYTASAHPGPPLASP